MMIACSQNLPSGPQVVLVYPLDGRIEEYAVGLVMPRRVLALITCLILGAGALCTYFLWKSTEPGKRYNQIRNLINSFREKDANSWDQADSKILWEDVSWLRRHAL